MKVPLVRFSICVAAVVFLGLVYNSGYSPALSQETAAGQRTFRGLREVNEPKAAAADQVIAIVHATIIDGTGAPPLADGTVLIRGDRIVAVGSQVEIPPSAEHFDASGLALLPGLLDAHFHIDDNPDRMYLIPPLFLSHGVTSVRDPGRPIDVYSRYWGDNPQLAPRLFLTGPHFDQAPPAWPDNAVVVNSEAEAAERVTEYFQQGASAIKVYFRLPEELIKTTCAKAHELGIPVTAHLELVDAHRGIAAGLDGIEHITSFGTDLAEPELAEKFRMAVAAENSARENGRYRLWASLDLDNSERVKAMTDLLVESGTYVSPTLATFERRAGDKDVEEFQVRGFENMLKFVGQCYQAGATIVTGSHTWAHNAPMGWAYQREMYLLHEAGMPNMEIIKSSTIHNARFFGCDDRLGSIEVGKLADLLLIEGDPLVDIEAMRNVRRVMLGGRWVEYTPPK